MCEWIEIDFTIDNKLLPFLLYSKMWCGHTVTKRQNQTLNKIWSASLKQNGSDRFKHHTRWQHISQMKDGLLQPEIFTNFKYSRLHAGSVLQATIWLSTVHIEFSKQNQKNDFVFFSSQPFITCQAHDHAAEGFEAAATNFPQEIDHLGIRLKSMIVPDND